MRSRRSSTVEPYTPDLFVPVHADLVAGVDEAGRGPLAGPVVAAAVMLHPGQQLEGLADSKTLTARRREQLAERIRAEALCCSVAEASVEEIDRLNILQATLLAMQRAVQGLRLKPTQVWVDGKHAPRVEQPVRCIVKGDALEPAISAASILAKVHRDAWCLRLHAEHPAYGFDAHKGYGTEQHLEAMRRLGPLDQHRRSFAPLREWLTAAR